jgi:hypothetical protein
MAAKVPSLKSWSGMIHLDCAWMVSSKAAVNALNLCRTKSREPLLLDEEEPCSPSRLRCCSTRCQPSRWYFNVFCDTCTFQSISLHASVTHYQKHFWNVIGTTSWKSAPHCQVKWQPNTNAPELMLQSRTVYSSH